MISSTDFSEQALRWATDAHLGNTERIEREVEQIRAWLQEMPARLQDTTLSVWADVVYSLLWATMSDDAVHAGDDAFLGAFFRHAEQVPMHVWMAEGEPLVDTRHNDVDMEGNPIDPSEWREARPAYDALNGVMGVASFGDAGMGPHPTFMALLQSGWEPSALLHHLDGARQLQMAYVENEQLGIRASDTAQGRLLEGILSAMGSSNWVPRDHPVWALLWNQEVHAYYRIDSHDPFIKASNAEQRRAALSAYRAFPHLAGLALEAHLSWPALHQRVSVQDMAPFPLGQSPGMEMLRPLLKSWQNKDKWTGAASSIANVLAVHHPEVAQLLDMHLSLYDAPHKALEHASDALEAFQHLVGVRQAQDLSLEHLNLDA